MMYLLYYGLVDFFMALSRIRLSRRVLVASGYCRAMTGSGLRSAYRTLWSAYSRRIQKRRGVFI